MSDWKKRPIPEILSNAAKLIKHAETVLLPSAEEYHLELCCGALLSARKELSLAIQKVDALIKDQETHK